jgi:uncharacterized protein YukE
MGIGDFTDWIEEGADTLGNLTEAVSTVQANAADSLGMDQLGNAIEFLGETNQMALQTFGNFATPVVDFVPTMGDYAADSVVAFSQYANDVAHGDPDAWQTLNEAGERINNETWDEVTGSFEGAWQESLGDYDQYLRDANEIYPSGPDNLEDLKDEYGHLWDQITNTLAGDNEATGTVTAPDPASPGDEGPGGLLRGALGTLGSMLGFGGGGTWEGMDVEAVEAAARQLQELSQRTTSLVAKVDGEVSELGASWNGVDSERYVQQWQGQYKAVLTKSAKLLEQMSQDALHQVAAQKQASGH